MIVLRIFLSFAHYFLGLHAHYFSSSNMHSLIYFLPRSCIPPTSPSITSYLPTVLPVVHVLPSLFSHHMRPQQGLVSPEPPSCLVMESHSRAVVAAGIPSWQWAPLGFMQRTETQSHLVCVWLRLPSDNIATNYSFASSLTSSWTSFFSSLWRELTAVKYILRVCKEGLLH